MDYEQFKTYVKESMEEVTGEAVKIYPIVKNNSVVYDALTVQAEDGCVAVPTIYLGEYYEAYQSGTPAPRLVRDMVNFYETKKRKVGIDLNKFQDFSWLKDKVGFKLINRERNKELLERIPHESFLDLELVFYLLFFGGEMGDSTMLIENSHMRVWGVTKEELYEAAMENMPLMLPVTFQPMDMVLKDLYRVQIESEIRAFADEYELEDELDFDKVTDEFLNGLQERQQSMPMYVLSNSKGFYGAGALLYCDKLDEWATEVEGDLFLIPSSIHEILVMPAEGGFYTEESITEMIKEINSTQVMPEEVLSDHVYIYKWKLGKITV